MGSTKKLLITFLNKRNFFVVKTYSRYFKDIFGFFRWKRSYKLKKILFNMLKRKSQYYYIFLNKLYHGIKFTLKEYKYKANLFFIKKRLKLFYGFFRDSKIGKIGKIIKRRMGYVPNFFFSIIERRIDVLLYRSLYSISIRASRYFIWYNLILLDNIIDKKKNYVHEIYKLIYVGNIIRIATRPYNPFFFRYVNMEGKRIGSYRRRLFLYFRIKKSIFRRRFWRLFKFKNLIPLLNYTIRFTMYKRSKRMYGYMYKYILKYYLYIKRLIKKKKKLNYQKTNFFKKYPYLKRVLKYRRKYTLFLPIEFRLLTKRYIYRLKYFYTVFIKLYKIEKKTKKFSFLSENIEDIHLPEFLFKFTYGIINFRIRIKKFFFLLKPRWFSKSKSHLFQKKFIELIKNKHYRYWKFSKYEYNFFKRFKYLYYVYMSYPSYMEVNYKSHMFILLAEPKVKSVHYPFTFKKILFYKFFVHKGYF